MTRMRRDHWLREIEKLDPESDYEEISRIVGTYEFPWDIQQSLSLALFRTYAAPSIGRLLFDTGNVQKRHDDTRWRKGMPAEKLAGVRYYQRLGNLMGITEIPETYEEFELLLDTYEADNFAFNEKSLAVADSTLALFESFYPRPARKAANTLLRALMDDRLLEAFHYKKPSAPVVFLAHSLMRFRGRVVALKPARKSPQGVADFRAVRSYPDGFSIDELGTFPVGCPVPHGQRPRQESSRVGN